MLAPKQVWTWALEGAPGAPHNTPEVFANTMKGRMACKKIIKATKPGVVAYASNPSIEEAKTE